VRNVAGTPRTQQAQLTDRALGAEVMRKARCADGTLDPNEWFPVSPEAEAARREAAGAIAICTACPVRAACLELSLRRWTIGQHGVWGGLVAAERAALRRRWLPYAHEYGGALPILDRISQVARYGYGQFAVAVAVAGRGGDYCERDTRPSAQDRAARTDSRAGRQPPAPGH